LKKRKTVKAEASSALKKKRTPREKKGVLDAEKPQSKGNEGQKDKKS